MPQIAVVLSGCGVYDGTEVHEAAAALGMMTMIMMIWAGVRKFVTLEGYRRLCELIKGLFLTLKFQLGRVKGGSGGELPVGL